MNGYQLSWLMQFLLCIVSVYLFKFKIKYVF